MMFMALTQILFGARPHRGVHTHTTWGLWSAQSPAHHRRKRRSYMCKCKLLTTSVVFRLGPVDFFRGVLGILKCQKVEVGQCSGFISSQVMFCHTLYFDLLSCRLRRMSSNVCQIDRNTHQGWTTRASGTTNHEHLSRFIVSYFHMCFLCLL